MIKNLRRDFGLIIAEQKRNTLESKLSRLSETV